MRPIEQAFGAVFRLSAQAKHLGFHRRRGVVGTTPGRADPLASPPSLSPRQGGHDVLAFSQYWHTIPCISDSAFYIFWPPPSI